MVFDPATLTIIFASTLGVWLPGAAVLVWQSERRMTGMERLGVSFGLGMAVVALAALAGRILSIRFTLPILAALEAASAILLVAGWIRRRRAFRCSAFAVWELLALIVLLGLRFFQARDLALPAWVDSVHHTFLVRLFLERGGIPADLQPWIPGPFYYHFGFHSAAALVAAVSGLPPDRVILVFGQILNAAAALSVYRLSMAIRPDRRIAILAMALAGFVARMPAYYLAWGRYTLLAGLILLPLAMAEAVGFMKRPRRPAGVRLALLTAGTLLTHYLAGLLLAAFLVLIGLSLLARNDRWERFPELAFSVGAGTAAALPWLVPMLRYSTERVGMDWIASAAALDEAYFANYASYLWTLLGPLRNYLLLGAGLTAGLAALFRRGPLRIFALWGLFLGMQTFPWGLRFAPFRPDHMAILLYLPAAVLSAHGLRGLALWIRRRRPVLRPRVFLAGAMLGFCLAGIAQSATLLTMASVFAGPDDRQAAEWAAVHTPADAIFLINTAPWQTGLYRGMDGGWWMLPLAGRRTLLPPMLYSFADSAYEDGVNRLASEVFQLKGCTADLWSVIDSQGVTHIYLTEGTGSLQPADLAVCPGVEEVYRVGKVRIYRVVGHP
jgi:hypothetical protein